MIKGLKNTYILIDTRWRALCVRRYIYHDCYAKSCSFFFKKRKRTV